MIKAKIIPAMALFSVMLASCDLYPEPKEPSTGAFYAQDIATKSFYKVKAKILYQGAHCEIWAETGSGVTKEMAKDIAREYDTVIRPRVVDTFSDKQFSVSYKGVDYHFDDALDFANWLTGRNNKKLTILLLDIKDGFQDPRTDSYVAGYFYAGDFLTKGANTVNGKVYYSNARDMIYVDTNPGLKENLTNTYATFAHELQHLVNFATCVLLDKALTDTWVNEGLSAFAEYLYLGENPPDKCGWLRSSKNTIHTGNNFFVWDDYSDKPLAILDDYATVYLFFRWLYLRAGAVTGLQSSIFRDIAHSNYPDYQAVTEAASQIDAKWGDWEVLLRTWLAANYYPQNSYGYTGDLELQEIIKIAPIAESNIPLRPGEGVYSIINNSFTPNNGSGIHIKYAGLAAGNSTITTAAPHSGTLLTFNANTDNKEGEETGYLTSVSPPPDPQTAAESARSAKRPGEWDGPYVIDAQDMLGRNKDMPIRIRVPR